ncbi:MAG: DUF6057 family protein [Bacteroidales bacterium]|nr:DUF6057 family protein [Bacteroidales bacterium]
MSQSDIHAPVAAPAKPKTRRATGQAPHPRSNTGIIAAVMAVFAVFSIAILAGNLDYVRKLDDLNLFLPTSAYLSECMQVPGGALHWAGSFFTQFFFHPWMGIVIFTLLSTALVWMVGRAFRLPGRLWPLAAVPSAMLLLWLILPGYVIYSLKTPGFGYSSLIGLMGAVALFWAYSRIRLIGWRAIVLVAIVAGGYPLMGFYALLSAVMCMAWEARQRQANSPDVIDLGLITVIAVPMLHYLYVPSLLMGTNLYTSGLPAIYAGEWSLIWPHIVIAVALVGLALANLQPNSRVSARWLSISSAAMAIALVLVVVFKMDDPNFRATIAMDRALQDGDWQKAADIARDMPAEPTRLNVLLCDIALMRLGTAGDVMFTYPIGSAPYQSPRYHMTMRDAGTMMLNYHFGRIYNTYRWGVEYMVEYGKKSEYFKYMAKTALINGEYELARKYLSTLAQTRYHREWAEKYLAYADNPRMVEQDPEMRQIKPLSYFRDHLGGDGAKVEGYLVPMVAGLRGGSPELLEASMQCNLILRNLDAFMKRFLSNYTNYDRVPTHYQEAVLLWSLLNQKAAFKHVHIDPAIKKRFDNFVRLNDSLKNLPPEEAAARCKDTFGNTYWYYFFYVNGLKTL